MFVALYEMTAILGRETETVEQNKTLHLMEVCNDRIKPIR